MAPTWMESCWKWMKELNHRIQQRTRFTLSFKGFLLLPLFVYLTTFSLAGDIPDSERPDIDVQTLPSIERVITFGVPLQHFPRSVLDPSHYILLSILDIVAAFVYLIHFGGVWVFGLILYLYHRKTDNPPVPQPYLFFFVFGILNISAVITQNVWPTAPPWFVEAHGLDFNASYNTTGDEADLENADRLLSIPLFHSLYGSSPIVFGSFPSLHASWPLLIFLFFPFQKRILKIFCFLYVLTVWWAALYLNHHWLVDILGAIVYVLLSYFLGQGTLKFILSKYASKVINKRLKWTLLPLETVEISKDTEMDELPTQPNDETIDCKDNSHMEVKLVEMTENECS